MASGQKDIGIFDSMRKARVISRIYLFFLSATLFCSGVYAQEVWLIRPFFRKEGFHVCVNIFPPIISP